MSNLFDLVNAYKGRDYEVLNLIAAYRNGKLDAEGKALLLEELTEGETVTLKFPGFPAIKGIGPAITAKDE